VTRRRAGSLPAWRSRRENGTLPAASPVRMARQDQSPADHVWAARADGGRGSLRGGNIRRLREESGRPRLHRPPQCVKDDLTVRENLRVSVRVGGREASEAQLAAGAGCGRPDRIRRHHGALLSQASEPCGGWRACT